jgi:hypothetical protein
MKTNNTNGWVHWLLRRLGFDNWEHFWRTCLGNQDYDRLMAWMKEQEQQQEAEDQELMLWLYRCNVTDDLREAQEMVQAIHWICIFGLCALTFVGLFTDIPLRLLSTLGII